MSEEQIFNKEGLDNDRHHTRKDDESHSTSGGKTGDPGRTPGTAEGDRADVEQKQKQQRESVEDSRTKNTRDIPHT